MCGSEPLTIVSATVGFYGSSWKFAFLGVFAENSAFAEIFVKFTMIIILLVGMQERNSPHSVNVSLFNLPTMIISVNGCPQLINYRLLQIEHFPGPRICGNMVLFAENTAFAENIDRFTVIL